MQDKRTIKFDTHEYISERLKRTGETDELLIEAGYLDENRHVAVMEWDATAGTTMIEEKAKALFKVLDAFNDEFEIAEDFHERLMQIIVRSCARIIKLKELNAPQILISNDKKNIIDAIAMLDCCTASYEPKENE